MKLYLAASYRMRHVLRELREPLSRHGITVTSSWIDQDFDDDTAPDDLETYATLDLAEVSGSDVVAVFTALGSTSGGMWVELGYALARGIPVVVVGDRTNVFCHLAHHAPPTWANAEALLIMTAARMRMADVTADRALEPRSSWT